MALKPDDTVCFCFHVPLRKIENFCKVEKPRAASQISECLSAGTGCGWCVPMLQKIHGRICGEYRPWWRQGATPACDNNSQARDATNANIAANEYAAGRQRYLDETGRNPPSPNHKH